MTNEHQSTDDAPHSTDEQCICGRTINEKVTHLLYHDIDHTDPSAISVYLCPICQQKLEQALPLS